MTLPSLFVSHGSPTFALEPGHAGALLREVGQRIEALPNVRAVLVVSPHWRTRGLQISCSAQPETIHDFGGFPAPLYALQYPAKGAPDVAREVADHLVRAGLPTQLDPRQGLDHGAWVPLMHMLPGATLPVFQLSLPIEMRAADAQALGLALAPLRERGVLIVGSGNIVHNLRVTRRGAGQNETYDWAAEFDTVVQDQIKKGQLDALAHFQKLGQVARMSHPTHEHYLPLLYAAGAARSTEMPRFFNTGFQSASISMRSVVWG